MNLTNLFLLSNEILNLEKISFLPRINGLFSLFDRAQMISIGVFVILIVILAMYALTPLPSIPLKRILGKLGRLTSRSCATDLGIILQSAPVSTRKSNFWYPYLVRTATGITGSAIIPNSCVCFWFKGKSADIYADGAFGGHESDSYYCPVNVFSDKFFYKLGVCFGMRKNMAVFSRDIFAGVGFLKLCVGDSFHIRSPLI